MGSGRHFFKRSLGGFLRARCGERANATRRGSSWIRSFVVCVTDDDAPAAQLCPGSFVYVVETPTLPKLLSDTLAVIQSLTSSPTTFESKSVGVARSLRPRLLTQCRDAHYLTCTPANREFGHAQRALQLGFRKNSRNEVVERKKVRRKGVTLCISNGSKQEEFRQEGKKNRSVEADSCCECSPTQARQVVVLLLFHFGACVSEAAVVGDLGSE